MGSCHTLFNRETEACLVDSVIFLPVHTQTQVNPFRSHRVLLDPFSASFEELARSCITGHTLTLLSLGSRQTLCT